MSALHWSPVLLWWATGTEAPVTVRYKSSPDPSSSFLPVSSLLSLRQQDQSPFAASDAHEALKLSPSLALHFASG